MLGSTKSQRGRRGARSLAEIRVVPCWLYYPVVPTDFREGNVQTLPAAFPHPSGTIRSPFLPPVHSSPVLGVGVYHQEGLETAFERYRRRVLGHPAGLAHDVDGVAGGVLVFQPLFHRVRHVYLEPALCGRNKVLGSRKSLLRNWK